MDTPTGHTPQMYECLDTNCRALHDETDVGSCRVDGYERLFCTVCGRDVRLYMGTE